ncbi:MAG: UDP-N-acetylglucosamine 2-epimerase (hydrolyzing) [Bdellovibrio sp. CG10_big_fil_rev_8_21_14_0_10_47_8]|nr:MAG: UDP-N-acetylglucosamine 2-epimerase (hydrolyzing) [Bdellovibrio sp. CG10_big_fil_rev_8_21_14_0_10_47_8]
MNPTNTNPTSKSPRQRRILVATGTRAEYGLLYWVMKEIQGDPELQLQVLVTGMHLSPEFGLTYKTIEADGFQLDAKVEMLLSSDSPIGIAKSMGLGTIGYSEALDRLRPDILLVLGDRFELLALAQAALVARIPIAHISGGDSTEGVVDEAIRHSLTKMSHLHFTNSAVSAKRVRQLGENPEHIFHVGHVGVDYIKRLQMWSRDQLSESMGYSWQRQNILITFHPVTLETQTSAGQFQELLNALDRLGPDVGLIFTKPNADTDGRILISMVDEFVATRPNAKAYTSLGQVRYLSTMSQVDAVVGNSSSALYEAPFLKKPTVNIGDRQRGRIQSSSIINCPPTEEAIEKAVREALVKDCSATENLFGDGTASQKIKDQLKKIKDPQALLKKKFFDL